MEFMQTWYTWENAFPERPWLKQRLERALEKGDLSLVAEFIAGAWLVEQGYILKRAELAKDRVLSPRRCEPAKTCDFEITQGESSARRFVEVKHTDPLRADELSLKSFAQSAHLKGANWLIVVCSENSSSRFELVKSRVVEKSEWSGFLPEKQLLKYCRNGFTKIEFLHVS